MDCLSVYSISDCPLFAILPGINKVLTLITCTHHFTAATASAMYLTLPLSHPGTIQTISIALNLYTDTCRSWRQGSAVFWPSSGHYQQMPPPPAVLQQGTEVFLQNTAKILKTLRSYYVLGIRGAVNGLIT